jgi:tetratricopeptide (TPR) repeat protein
MRGGGVFEANRPLLAIFALGLLAFVVSFVVGMAVAFLDWQQLPWASLNHLAVVRNLREAGEIDRAIEEFEAEQNLNVAEARNGIMLAALLSGTGRPGAAEALGRNSENTFDPEMHLRYALKLAQQGRFEEFAVAVRRAEISANGAPEVWVRVGEIYERVLRPTEAAQAYAKALEIDPDLAPAREALQRLESDGAPSREASP